MSERRGTLSASGPVCSKTFLHCLGRLLPVTTTDLAEADSQLDMEASRETGAIQIEQSFVRDLPESTSSLAIVRAILAMAHSLGIDVIAEGVENQAQCDALRESGCKHFQGYLFGKPLAVDVFDAATAKH